MAETKLGDGETPHSAGRWAFLIGAGTFATTLAQSSDLALPLRNMLTEELKEPLRATSLFFAIVAVPWYFKIVVGLLSDSIPLFGTRRRHYLLVSATLAGALWLSAGYIPRSYLCVVSNFFRNGGNACCWQHNSRRAARRGWTTARSRRSTSRGSHLRRNDLHHNRGTCRWGPCRSAVFYGRCGRRTHRLFNGSHSVHLAQRTHHRDV